LQKTLKLLGVRVRAANENVFQTTTATMANGPSPL
jgi:hypothetical protein